MDNDKMKEVASAVGHIPSGLFIVCSRSDDGVIDGYLASWVQQISFRPLLVALAINPDRPGYANIISGKTFSINVVGDHEAGYMRYFWKGYGPADNPFKAAVAHRETPSGGVLLEGAKSTIDCRFVSKSKPGDHELLIAEVVGSSVQNADAKPKTHVRKSGLDY